MTTLKDMPTGTIWAHLLDAIAQNAIADIEDYAASRRKDIARGAETPPLAALLVDKYGAGMSKALAIAGIESDVQDTTDRLVREIDPNFVANRDARWATRPAGVSLAA